MKLIRQTLALVLTSLLAISPAQSAVKDWSTTAASNTTLGGLSTQGTAPANTIDDLFREIMSQLATFFINANFQLDSTDAGATVGPTAKLYRNSATPAAADIAGRVLFQGEDSAGNTEDYAEIDQQIDDTTSTSEDATIRFRNKVAGTMTTSALLNATGFNSTAIGVTTAAAGRFTTLVYTTSLTLLGSASPTPTAEGAVEWDTDGDFLVVGNGSTQTLIAPKINGTLTVTTSGTAVSFSSLPAGIKKITVSFVGVSTNGTSAVILQLGDSGGFVTTSYAGGVWTSSADAAQTAGFQLVSASASAIRHGSVVLTLVDAATNTWACSGSTFDTGTSVGGSTAGTRALSGTLDRLRLTAANGTDTFDLGSMNIQYEF